MANFSARAGEMVGLVDAFRTRSIALILPQNNATNTTLTPAEEAAVSDQELAERLSFAGNISEYIKDRNDRLNELLDGLSRSREGDKDTKELWRAKTTELRVDAIASLDSLLSAITKPTPLAAALKLKFSFEEEQFNSALFDLGVNKGVGESFQQLALLYGGARTMLLNSEKEWLLLLDKAEEVQRTAADAVKRLLSNLLDSPGAGGEVIANLTKHGFAVTQIAHDVFLVEPKRTISQLRDEAEFALNQYAVTLDKVQSVIDGWRTGISRAKTDIDTLKSLQAAEIDSLHRVFKEKRRVVQEFAKDPPTKKADVIVDRAKSAISSFPGVATDGQKDDWELLSEEILKEINGFDELIGDRWFEIQTELKGRFLDTVSDDTVQQLGQLTDWNGLRASFRARNDPETLRTLKSRAEQPGTRPETGIDELISNLNTRSGDSDREKRSFISFLENERSKISGRDQKVRSDLVQVCDEGIALLEGPDLIAIVTREPISRSLRS